MLQSSKLLRSSLGAGARGGLLRVSQQRLGGGGLKPGWALPANEYHKYTYQPTIPDKHYNVRYY